MYMFMIHVVYLVSIAAAYIMFTFGFARRNYFALRAAASFVAVTCIIMFVPDDPFGIKLPISLNTISVLLCLILVTKFMFAITWKGALFYAVSVPLLQHLSSTANRFLMDALIPNDILPPGGVAPFNCSWPRRIVFFAGHIAVYLIVYFVFLWRKRDKLDPSLKSWQLIIFSLLATIIVFVLGNYVYHRLTVETGFLYYVPTMISCFMLLYALFMTNKKSRIEQEDRVIKTMLEEQQRRYEAMAASIENVNRKVHDLKYLLASVQNSGSDGNCVIERIKSDVKEYESHVHTGNIALDNTIAERKTAFTENGIIFECSIDGSRLSFMEPADIYVLFGNAIDNAIECVKGYPEREKRRITLSSFSRGSLYKVSVVNYCDSARTFSDGVPQTTKQNVEDHGYGCKSMRYVAARYGGNIVFSCKQEQNVFAADMLFTLGAN